MKKLLTLVLLSFLFTSLKAQDISKLYTQVNPSVVTITVEAKEVITDKLTMSKSVVTSSGLGSGVVISEDGKIMTAAHVVEAADKVVVTFNNGEEVPAEVVTANADTDVALIKLLWLPKNLKVARLGDSDLVDIGNQVVVIGAPLGLEHSLSVGHISGRLKEDRLSDNFTKPEFFQTDASINHGNSGGPMFNMKGEVIGIVSFILSQSGGFEGIGFAVTSNLARQELLGKQPFWFGITHEPLVGPLAAIFNVPQEMGLLLQKVATNSPADIAGLQPGIFEIEIEGQQFLAGGDIILEVAGFKVEPTMDMIGFRKKMAEATPGSQISIKVLRAGTIMEIVAIVPE